MRTSTTVTLILVGGAPILAPIVSDHLRRAQLVAALGEPGVTSVNLVPTPSELYRLGCWVAGVVMIAAAVRLACAASEDSERK